jgi:hypothetical protein
MAGSSNFQQWNPAAANQQTDAQYTSDTSRTGGAGSSSIFPSATANKLFYQLSTAIAALNQALSTKGYVCSDANLNQLATIYGNLLTQADMVAGLATVAYSAAPTFNAAAATGFDLTLTGNVTSSTLTNIIPGKVITFVIVQDATGGRTFAWPTNVIGAGTPDTTAGAVSVQSFFVRADSTARPLTVMTVS